MRDFLMDVRWLRPGLRLRTCNSHYVVWGDRTISEFSILRYEAHGIEKPEIKITYILLDKLEADRLFKKIDRTFQSTIKNPRVLAKLAAIGSHFTP